MQACACGDLQFQVRKEMARPVIAPLNIQATAPETFCVLEQRMRMAEEQAECLISDLKLLGINSQRLTGKYLEYEKSGELPRPISPVRAPPAFTGDADTLWRNCENLVSRMCHIESMLQTLKLHVFRVHTDRELHTKHSADLGLRLHEIQEEHAQEIKDVQLEKMRLCQKLNIAIEDLEREMEAKERLSAALEIATTTKNQKSDCIKKIGIACSVQEAYVRTPDPTDVTRAAEEMKATKVRMAQRLVEVQEKLSQETALRALLEEEQATLLLTVQDMKDIVEEEQAQVQDLQQYCHTIQRETQEVKDKLKQEESRCDKLEKESEARELLLSKLQEEIKITRQKLDAEQAELSQIRRDSVTLREAAEKVQCLNQQLESQCTELTATIQTLTSENIQLKTHHQKTLKIVEDSMAQKLQKQEFVLSTVQTSLNEELQTLQSHRTQLERDLESLRAEHSECQRKIALAAQKNAVHKDMQDSTIARLRADLESALRDRAALDSEKTLLQEELAKTQINFQDEKQNLEIQLTESKLKFGSVQASLLAQEEENKRLVDHMAVLEQEQSAKRQVELLLTELTNSKSKLAYEKGKLESTVLKLQSELQAFCDAHTENSKLRKLNGALKVKYTQSASELDSFKIRLQRTEAKLQQTENILIRKEEDFTLAVHARNEAIKEFEKLTEQIKVLEEKAEHHRKALQQQLSDVCEERSRMSETLDNVLCSHTKLQKDLEKLQTELGRKDTDILNLHKDRADSQKQMQKLEAKLSDCQKKLQESESQLYGKIELLQRSMDIAQEDNRKLGRALDQAFQRSSLLQRRVEELEEELQNKKAQEKQFHLFRMQVEEEVRTKEQLFEERLISLNKQHQIEYKEAKKIARKEAAELKKALDCATKTSAELSRTNRQLRTQDSLLQKEILQQKDALRRLKTKYRFYIESKETRNQAERTKELEAELESMQKVKEEYERSNNEQCRRIQEFMGELGSLQKEITAATSCRAQVDILQGQLEKETKSRQELEERCKVGPNLGDVYSHFLCHSEEVQIEKKRERSSKKATTTAIKAKGVDPVLRSFIHLLRSCFIYF
ncbi:coiled-coil domain-containing protein 150 isoform X2 [Hyperolius riggenbachi]|uniref:coiled-coil domain-containing protein 150 isoform X2 n=1 Tax=Hyperolius riggenbachi TaxID=752182 RepID=UPI0035A26520